MADKTCYRIEIETRSKPERPKLDVNNYGWRTGMLAIASSGSVSMKRSYTEELTEKEATLLRLKGATVTEVTDDNVEDWKVTIFKNGYRYEENT